MCGRYVTVSKITVIEKCFNVVAPQPTGYAVRANIGPGSGAPVISNKSPGEFQFLTFGFTPFRAKKPMYVFNARVEGDHNKEDDPDFHGTKGIISKPMFRQSIRSKRCLVPADAYIEGPKKERLSKPHVVYQKSGERPFAFAGIRDQWVNQDTGEEVSSFAIITTAAYGVLHKIDHHRVPLILPPEAEEAWLSNDIPLGDITSLLIPGDPKSLNAYPIDPAFKNPTAEGLDLLRATGERLIPEYDYPLSTDLKLEGMGSTTARQRRLDFE